MEQSDIQQELRAMTDGMEEWAERRERRRTSLLNGSIAAVAMIVIVLLVQKPKPDGFYVSNLSNRTEVLASVNEMILYAKL